MSTAHEERPLDPVAAFGSFSEEVQRLAVELAGLLDRTSAESKWHLQTALGARRFGGVGGDVLLRIPRRQSENVVMKWVGGGLAALCLALFAVAGCHAAVVHRHRPMKVAAVGFGYRGSRHVRLPGGTHLDTYADGNGR